jgi:hypothetical protein
MISNAGNEFSLDKIHNGTAGHSTSKKHSQASGPTEAPQTTPQPQDQTVFSTADNQSPTVTYKGARAGSQLYTPINEEDEGAFTTSNNVKINPFEENNNIRRTAYVAPSPPPEDKEWTVLVYMAGDNDLEPYLVNNLIALEKVGSSPKINVVAELDRGDKPRSPVTKWKGSRRFLVQKSDDPKKITSAPVQDLGDVNMADPAHLSDFVQWGMKNYPAKHYMLIINDHGYGFMGAADDKGSKDTMNLPGLGKAFKEITEQMNRDTVVDGVKDASQKTGKKIDIIGFDACLMGQVEVAYELKDYADLMVASQEVIGSGGWPYGNFQTQQAQFRQPTKGPSLPDAPPVDMFDIPGMDPTEIGTNSVLCYFLDRAQKVLEKKGEITPETFAHGIITQCEKHVDTTPTMAAIRLGDYIGDLVEDMKEMSVILKASPDKEALLDIIKRTQNFNLQAPDQNPYGDYRDLRNFCELIVSSKKLTDKKLKPIARKVRDAVDDVVLDKIDTKLVPDKYKNANGISVYLPDVSGGTDYGYMQTRFAKETDWLDGVRTVAVNDPEEKWEPLYRPPELKGPGEKKEA